MAVKTKHKQHILSQKVKTSKTNSKSIWEKKHLTHFWNTLTHKLFVEKALSFSPAVSYTELDTSWVDDLGSLGAGM